MSLDRRKISNGISITFIDSDKFKTNHIGINLICSLSGDKASKNALLSKVLKRGSGNYPTMAKINRELDFLYSAKISAGVYKVGEAQVIGFSADMLDNKYALDDTDIADRTLDILGDILTNPLVSDNSFKNEYVEGEKINLKNDIDAQINNKKNYSYQRCVEIMCKDEKYSINNLGTKEDVSNTDAKNLYTHYRYVMSAYTIEIFCVGQFENKEKIENKFKSIFENLDRGTLETFETNVVKKAAFKGETTEKMPVNQGKLSIGFRLGTSNKEANYPSFILFNSLYGASPTSKLFENVREKLSLCYYCQTTIEAAKGLLTVLSGVESENKQKAIDEILKQLEEVKNNNFTDKEIEEARTGVINSYKGVFDDAGSIEFWYLRRLLSGVMKTPEESIDDILKVTREDMKNAANMLSLDTIYFLEGDMQSAADGEKEGEE